MRPVADGVGGRMVRPLARRDAARTRLLCFPGAGGGASLFRGWAERLPADVEVCAVQLPGREDRLLEPPLGRMADVVAALLDAAGPLLDRPFAFFGHSMGAVVCWEFARALREHGIGAPQQVLVASCRPPRFHGGTTTHVPSDEELVAELDRLAGAPREVLRSAEFLSLLLPTLRADHAIVATYEYVPGTVLDCPVTAYGGRDDPVVTPRQLAGWADMTTAGFELGLFPGGHSWLRELPDELIGDVAARLR